MTLKERVYALIKEEKTNAHRVEMELGLANAYLRRLDEYTPKPATLKLLADRFHVTQQWLLTGEELNTEEERRFTLPLLGYVRAGQPVAEYENVIDRIPAQYTNNEEYFGLMIKGDSMEPRFYEGDVVIVHSQPDAENGQIVVAQINGDEAVVKKLIKFAHGIALQSLNPAYPLLQFTEEEIEKKPVRILGRVVESRARF